MVKCIKSLETSEKELRASYLGCLGVCAVLEPITEASQGVEDDFELNHTHTYAHRERGRERETVGIYEAQPDCSGVEKKGVKRERQSRTYTTFDCTIYHTWGSALTLFWSQSPRLPRELRMSLGSHTHKQRERGREGGRERDVSVKMPNHLMVH